MTELRATYRLQLTADFGFGAARSLIPYLRDLGVSHLYLSPSLKARPGSQHGYDVIDPCRLSDALGGEDEFRRLAGSVHDAGMGLVLDVVPNHMAVDDGNRYWADPGLREKFFDIDPSTGRHRRFFDIDDLAGVRQEDPDVFEETHSLVLSLVDGGLVDGLRIDHPDGLADPAGYLATLRARGVERVWVEKILDGDEHLRDWPVCGTVGYEFLNDVCGLFIDPAAQQPLTDLWKQVSHDDRTFAEFATEAKLEQVYATFMPELERLVRELGADQQFTGPAEFVDQLAQALASLPVYRTYVDAVAGVVDPADRHAITEAQTSGGLAQMPAEIAQMLLLERPAPPGFVTRFQQSTPALMAKGVEDTAFYRYGRLLALNDVGGDPGRFGISPERFHAGCLERASRFPLNLLTTQTHDAKRSGDVRARIGALASMPEEWAAHVGRWFEIGAGLLEGGAPDAVEQYFVFQTLVGVWPIELERIDAYIEKALREAKRNTTWVNPSPEWEQATKRFCRALLAEQTFIADFSPFLGRVRAIGERAAIGQLVLKLTAPGVPDIYQGDELPFRALVDPDNRRPIDWQWHQAMLSRLMGGSPPDQHTLKLWVTLRLLTLRARRPEPFLTGGYEPVDADEGTCAFVRGGDVLVVVALREGAADGRFEAPQGRWNSVLRGGEWSFRRRERVSDVVDPYGVAVFERIGP